MEPAQIRNVLEACLLVAGRPMQVRQLEAVFEGDEDRPDTGTVREALATLASEYEGRGIELVEVAGGYRLQTRSAMEHWVARLFTERAPRYSRALLETLVLIAYRQPITRGEIEEVRGVAVSSTIVRTLQERRWVREIGHKDVPGKPALLGTTSEFLDYFNLKRLDELPSLAELGDLESAEAILAAELGVVDDAGEAANDGAPGADPDAIDEAGETSAADGGDVVEAGAADGTGTKNEAGGNGPGASAHLSMSVLADRFAPAAQTSAESSASVEGPTGPSSEGGTERPLDAQSRLRQSIDEFAEEHRLELEARDTWQRLTLAERTAPQADGANRDAEAPDTDERGPEPPDPLDGIS